MMRAAVALFAVAAGIGAGAVVFKMVGEEKIGGAVKGTVSQLGFSAVGNGDANGALDLLDKIAPGSKDNLQTAVIVTVVVSLLTATAIAVAVEEIAS